MFAIASEQNTATSASTDLPTRLRFSSSYSSLHPQSVSYTPISYVSSGVTREYPLIMSHPLLYELYTTGEVRFGYSQGDDLLRTVPKALFFRLRARITSLVAHTMAARILGYSCLVEKKVRFRPFPSQHHEYNPYFLLAPPSHFTSIEAHTSAPVQTWVDVAVA